jgi:hypothetical protein
VEQEASMFWPIFISAVTFWGLALGGAAWFARRYVRAIEARNAGDIRIAELEARVAALESGGRNLAALPPVAAGGDRPSLPT